jgi:hypothetical protein
MAGFEEAQAVLHPVRVKLYPNYLSVEGKYLARTDAYRSLGIEEICGNLRERGSFSGSPEDAANNITQFCEECGFLLCDGFSLNMKYYSISPRVNGTWDSAGEVHDQEKHPIGFTFRTLKPLKDLASRIQLAVEGIVETPAFIDEVQDVASGTVNDRATPGGAVVITGRRIKIAGDKPGVGMAITGTRADGSPYTGTIMPPYIENTASKIIAILPAGIPEGAYRIQVNTQFTGSIPLKDVRVIWSGDLSVGALLRP